MKTVDRLNAVASAGAVVAKGLDLREVLQATGVYHGICRGYKPQHEKEYLKEHARLLEMRARQDRMLAGTEPIDAAFIAYMKSYEDYLHTLTEVKWEREAPNVVTTVGKNALLDSALAGSSYTAACFMGLIGAVSYTTGPAAGDTMASHGGWTEAGATNAPTYTSPRKTISWSAASSGSKSPSSAPVFAITGTGTAKGVFIVFGSGAVSTIDSTAGILLSAGLFTGGDQAVVNTNTLTVTYSISL